MNYLVRFRASDGLRYVTMVSADSSTHAIAMMKPACDSVASATVMTPREIDLYNTLTHGKRA